MNLFSACFILYAPAARDVADKRDQLAIAQLDLGESRGAIDTDTILSRSDKRSPKT